MYIYFMIDFESLYNYIDQVHQFMILCYHCLFVFYINIYYINATIFNMIFQCDNENL